MDKGVQKTFKKCRKWTLILSGLGLLLSCYAFFVSSSKEMDSSYKALCDISETMSCSRVLTSEYSKGFGLVGKLFGTNSSLYHSNALYGMVFYTAVGFTCIYPAVFLAKIQLLFAIMSFIVTVYLSFILFYVLETICVVCVATYIINSISLLVAIKYYKVTVDLKKQASATDYSSYLDGRISKKRV